MLYANPSPKQRLIAAANKGAFQRHVTSKVIKAAFELTTWKALKVLRETDG